MDLMDLCIKISVDSDSAERAIKNVSDMTKQTAQKSNGFLSGIGNGFKKIGSAALQVGKVAAVGLGAAATAATALTKTAVSAYADYEQLTGGVEKLFGNSSLIVNKYANNAYKTAGMSANNYLQTVTSFSASLLQSLGGNTYEAARKADLAIKDMSDNANTFGFTVDYINNAYKGFAKGQFQLLDNLSLGYGGTKEEMQRLLSDAEKLPRALGRKFDISNYADIVDAIHLVQEEMGITGTTAKEAEHTISGSLGMVKNSWQNLVLSLAGGGVGVGQAIENLEKSVESFLNNLSPVILKTLPSIAKAVSKLVSNIGQKLPSMLQKMLPDLLNASVQLIQGLVSAMPQFVQMIIACAPMFAKAGIEIAKALWNGLKDSLMVAGEGLEQLMPSAFGGITKALQGLFDGLQSIFDGLVEAVTTVANAFSENGVTMQSVWETLGEVFALVGETIGTALRTIGDVVAWLVEEMNTDGTVIQTIWFAIQGCIQTAVEIIKGVLQIAIDLLNGDFSKAWVDTKTLIANVWNIVKDHIAKIWENIKTIFVTMLTTIRDKVSEKFNEIKEKISSKLTEAKSKVSEKFTEIKTTISNKLNEAKTAVDTIFGNIKNAITDKINAARDAVQRAIEAIKGFFNFSWSLPHLALPHFSVSGGFSLNPPSVPHFSVSWYRKAFANPFMLDGSSIFGFDGQNFLGGGENGKEMIYGHDALMKDINAATNNGQMVELLRGIYRLLDSMKNSNTPIYLNDREIGRALRGI